MAKIESQAALQFMGKLKAGQYSSLANCKRAIGKANISDAEKALCLKAAEKQFAGEARPPATKNGKAKSVVTKKAAAKPAAKKKAVKAAPKKKKAARRAPAAKETPGTDLEVQRERIGFLTASIDAMKKAKDISPEVNVGPGPQKACDALGAIIDQIHQQVLGDNGQITDPSVLSRLAQTAPVAPDVAVGDPAQPQTPPFGTS